MDESPKARFRGPPQHPRLRERIELNRRSQPVPPKDQVAGFRGWHERGYVPHRDAPGLIQFVTFRLVDSFPADRRQEWEHLLKMEDRVERRSLLEAYLDLGYGSGCLRDPRIARLTVDALKHFDGERYRLIAWAVMPNHVHVLFETGSTPMSELVGSWKRFAAAQANKLLGRSGAFWQADYWDTFMRDAEHVSETHYYIENNPEKAGLSKWPWRSHFKLGMEDP